MGSKGDKIGEIIDVVVCIPSPKLPEIEAEEADVARREAAGETGIRYYWQIGRLPKVTPRRIYFVWKGAIRAYHEVDQIDRNTSRIVMQTKIHEVDPIPMESFRGFRYRKVEP